MTTKIDVQRCRSQNTNNTPMEWETVATHATPAAAIADCWEFERFCRASGDQFRIAIDGVAQMILSETELLSAQEAP